MNILILSNYLFPDLPGGSARVPWEIARQLAAGHGVLFVTKNAQGKPEREMIEGVDVIRYPWSQANPFIPMWRFQETLEPLLGGIDIVHIHHPLTGLFARFIKTLRKLPKLYFFHSPWAQEYRIRAAFNGNRSPFAPMAACVRQWIERSIVSRSDMILTLSRFMEDQLKSHHHPPAEKLARMTGAVDIQRFRPAPVPEARQKLGWPGDKTVLFTIRNLEARMGLENLLDAFHALVPGPSAHLFIGGRGSLREFLEIKAKNLGIAEQVTFLGFVPDDRLPLCYQAADAFVLPTRELEGFGLVTVEALACGCPVVGTPIGGTPEILSPLDAGLLARDASPTAIAEALRRFLDRRDQWPALRQRAASYARQKYSWEKVAGDVETFSRRLTEESHGR